MKKILSLLTVVSISAMLSVSAAEATSVGTFFNKLNQKEQEINNKIDAQQKASAAKRAEIEKRQVEQKKAAEAKQAALKKQQEANKKALEQAKKDAQNRQEARKKAIDNEVNAWKNLLNNK